MTATVLLLDSSGAKLPPLADVFIKGENRADPGQKRDFLLTVPNAAANIMPWGSRVFVSSEDQKVPHPEFTVGEAIILFGSFWIFFMFIMF